MFIFSAFLFEEFSSRPYFWNKDWTCASPQGWDIGPKILLWLGSSRSLECLRHRYRVPSIGQFGFSFCRMNHFTIFNSDLAGHFQPRSYVSLYLIVFKKLIALYILLSSIYLCHQQVLYIANAHLVSTLPGTQLSAMTTSSSGTTGVSI